MAQLSELERLNGHLERSKVFTLGQPSGFNLTGSQAVLEEELLQERGAALKAAQEARAVQQKVHEVRSMGSELLVCDTIPGARPRTKWRVCARS